MTDLYNFFEFIGTVAFAISGASNAIKKDMDLLGVIVLGMITAVGGGMLRDMIGNISPAIFSSPGTIFLAFMTSIITFLVAYISEDFVESLLFNRIFLISDSVGLAVFTIFGCKNMLPLYPPAVGVFFGVLTGVGGGLLRDVIAGETPYVLTKHFYASSCILGAIVYILFLPYKKSWAVILGMLVVFFTRLLAAQYRWNLPKINRSKKVSSD